PYDSIKKAWSKLCGEAGIPGFWLRWLRDTAKYRWGLAGFGPFGVAPMLGHSSPAMTMTYLILDPKPANCILRSGPKLSQKEKRESEALSQEIELIPNGTTL